MRPLGAAHNVTVETQVPPRAHVQLHHHQLVVKLAGNLFLLAHVLQILRNMITHQLREKRWLYLGD